MVFYFFFVFVYWQAAERRVATTQAIVHQTELDMIAAGLLRAWAKSLIDPDICKQNAIQFNKKQKTKCDFSQNIKQNSSTLSLELIVFFFAYNQILLFRNG